MVPVTWETICPNCGSETFELTRGSSGQVHVNCANPECFTYIGQIPPEQILHEPADQPH